MECMTLSTQKKQKSTNKLKYTTLPLKDDYCLIGILAFKIN